MAEHRHKRDTDARRLFGTVNTTTTVLAGLAALATMAAVAAGVLFAPVARDVVAGTATSDPAVLGPLAASQTGGRTPADLRDELVVSRSSSRKRSAADKDADMAADKTAKKRAFRKARADALAETAAVVRRADTTMWTTAPLNLWTTSGDAAVMIGVVAESQRVLVTRRHAGDRVEIVVGGKIRWVTAGYLDEEKPVVGIGGACTNGTSVSSGVSANIVEIHQAVCSAFPSITVYGTLRGGGGDHSIGKAVDIMVSGALGWQVAEFVREHYLELGVSYVIYSQNIWSVERGGEGWRGMSDRGSRTANHYDHVHVSVY